ncbi:MAG: Hpt domain [Actinomycetota bacterium]|jgi:HPt (histidine-containing phosphotransfer) domain-containing protein
MVGDMAVLDERVLARLVADLGESAVDDLVRTYLDALPARRAAIAEAMATPDLGAARRVAHQLRSTSHLVGATSLGEASAWLEAVAIAGDGDGARQAVDEVGRLVPEVARALQTWLIR